MSDSLFTSVTKSGSLFAGMSESSSSKGGLFGNKPAAVPISVGGGIFSRLASGTSTSSARPFTSSSSKGLFAVPSSAVASSVTSSPKATSSPPKSPMRTEGITQRRRSLRVTPPTPTGSGMMYRDSATPSGRRRSSASSQISRKYLRLQQAASVKTHRGSEEQESGKLSPEATPDLVLSKVPPAVNNRDALRSLLSPFGNVRRTFCKLVKATAIVHFNSAAEASRARHGIPTLPELKGVLVLYSSRRSNRTSIPSPAVVLKHQSLSSPPVVLKRQQASAPQMVQAKVAKLDGLQRTVARSAGERLEVLKQRDELLRKALGRTDLSKLPGICPDMCPERERYARQEQHRLSIFEVVSGSHPSQVRFPVVAFVSYFLPQKRFFVYHIWTNNIAEIIDKA